MSPTGRFAPSATGPAHPGTLLAALLCWLDARSQGARLVLRLEDLDPQRCSPALTDALIEQVAWFGLDDWDVVERQSDHGPRHHRALGQLVAGRHCYPCHCSRRTVKDQAALAVDGGFVYPGTCRNRGFDGPWEACREPIRVRLEAAITLIDDGGHDCSQDLHRDMGDPVLRRRDGAIAYHLASVVDDAAQGVTRVVRGRDLATATATQLALQSLLGLPQPAYRHHLLLCEPGAGGRKFAKFHGAVGVPELRRHYAPADLCGLLAQVAGLQDDPTPRPPQDLLAGFDWQRVRHDDQALAWEDGRLHWLGPADA